LSEIIENTPETPAPVEPSWQDGIEIGQAVRSAELERDAAIVEAAESYFAGEQDFEPLVNDLAAWGPEAQNALAATIYQAEQPASELTPAEFLNRRAEVNEALVSLRQQMATAKQTQAQQSAVNAQADAIATVRDANPDFNSYLPVIGAALADVSVSTPQEAQEAAKMALRAARESARVIEGARIQAEAEFSFPSVDKSDAWGKGLTGQDPYMTKAEYAAEKQARIDLRTADIASRSTPDINRVAVLTPDQVRAAELAPFETIQRRNASWDSEMEAVRQNAGKPRGEIGTARTPLTDPSATIPAAEITAGTPVPQAVEKPAKQDFWDLAGYRQV
jgi:hypothetical protein